MLARQIVSCKRNMFALESETSNKRAGPDPPGNGSHHLRVYLGVTSMPLLQRRCDYITTQVSYYVYGVSSALSIIAEDTVHRWLEVVVGGM